MATTTTFVTNLYQNILGRAPSSAELNYWSGKINFNEMSQPLVAQTIIGSGEAQGTPASVIRLYQTYFGRTPGLNEVQYYTSAINGGSRSLATVAQQFSLSNEFSTRFGSGNTNTAFVQNLYTNVLNRNATQTDIDYYNARLAAGESRGSIALSFNESPEFKTSYGPTVNAALANAGISGSIPAMSTLQQQAAVNLNTLTTNLYNNPTTGGATGATLPLTTGVDTIVGTDANNTIDGSRAVLQGQVLNSLNNADSIDGGGGTDTLFFQATAAGTTTPSLLKNVEIISIEAQAAATLDLINGDASVTTIRAANSAAGATVTNINSAPTTFEVSTTSNAFTAGITTTKLSGSADAAALTLTNVTGAAAITIGNVAATGGNGYETFNITSSGSVANSITLDDTAGAAAAGSLATINISGANALTLASAANMTTVTKVDASAFTGALTYTAAATNGQAMTVTGGTGNDVLNVNGYTTADTINGGAGTADRLILTNAEATGATATQSNVTGIEVISVNNTSGTISLTNFGATGFRFVDGSDDAGATTLNYSAGTNSLELRNAIIDTGALTATIAGTATTDVLNVTAGTDGAALGTVSQAVVINGAETVNLVSQGGANTFGAAFTMTDTAATQTLTITGSQSVTFTGAVRADVVNASGMTGSAALTLTGGTATTATTITGTGNADVLNGSTAGDIITGGAGNDTIGNVITGTAASAGDVLTGGAGFDTFVLRGDTATGALSTIYSTTSQITDFTVGSTATTTDILALSSTNTNYANAATGFAAGIAATTAVAAGSTAIQTVAQNAAAAAYVTGTDLIKLTTAVDTTGLTLQAAFNAAIGTATVTGLGAGTEVFFSLYDSANSRMVVGLVDTASGTNTVVESADTVSLVGSINMTAADYANFSANNLAFVVA